MKKSNKLRDADYATLSDFRYTLRSFVRFSEERAIEVGLTPQQHQGLLAIRGAERGAATIGYVAKRLFLKPHSATGLVDRLVDLELVTRQTAEHDRRQTQLFLSDKAEALLAALSTAHREEILRLKPLLSELLGRLD
ncbi:hypothetical protein ACFB49_22420 [Sphingomonas sp. DBB INV C78]|uniref:MarR family winged helix-turn-helix transcriptional regulator n=1 Tax=Sphingomonas sp. DBB INV C78 TaxID=3349434 RepID=UPI0036D3D716